MWSLFGKELKRAREAMGLTQEQLGQKVAYSRGQIGMIENAQRSVRAADTVHQLDQILGTDGLLHRIWGDALAERTFLQIADLRRAEAEATLIREYHPVLVPGLLQTEGYMRSVFGNALLASRDPAEIDEHVAQRLTRQAILADGGLSRYVVILDESVIQRIIGTAEVMREQLDHLLRMMGRRGMTIQVMPFRLDTYPASGPIKILGSDSGSVVHLEPPVGGGTTTTDPHTMQECNEQFDLLRAQALPRADSARLIRQRIEELTP